MVEILEKSEHNVDFHPIVDLVEASPLSNTIMARLQFCDYHNMIAILEKSEYNVDFHPMVDFIEASPVMIETMEEGTKILATVDGILKTVSESSLRRNLKLKDEEGISSLPDTELFKNLTLMGYNISPNQKFTFQKGFNEFSSNIGTALVCLATNRTYNFSKMIFDGLVKNVNNKVSKFLMYLRARIAQSSALPPVANEPVSPLRDISQGEACPTDSGFIADHDRATIAKSSTLPYDSAPRVTSPVADEGSMQQTINKLTTLCTSLQRQHSELLAKFQAQEIARDAKVVRIHVEEELQSMIDRLNISNETVAKYLQEYQQFASELPLERRIELIKLLAKFQAQEVEINRLKERVKLLKDRERVDAKRFGDDAPIKGKSLDEGEAAAERVSNDSEEMATVLTSIDVATILAGRIVGVPTSSGSIPTASPPADEVPIGSDVVPTASPVFATATVEIARVLTSIDAATVLAGGIDVPTGSGSIPTAGPPATFISTGSEVGPTASPIATRKKGKEVMVDFDAPKKKKLQEQIDAQVARELEEQQEKENMRMNKHIARDAKVARIHAEEEL
nr:hypothetical protein [Tanacetum cinerariifolium]